MNKLIIIFCVLLCIQCKKAPDEIALLREELKSIKTTSDETFGHIVKFNTLKHLEKVIFHNTTDQKAVNLIANFETLDEQNTRYLNDTYNADNLLQMEGKERERVAALIKADSISVRLRERIKAAKIEKETYLTETFEDYAKLRLKLKIVRKTRKSKSRKAK